jgi:hypothetical protein
MAGRRRSRARVTAESSDIRPWTAHVHSTS